MEKSEFLERFLPDLAVDVVLLSVGDDGSLQTLLTRRTEVPFRGAFALPGVFVRRDESLDRAASRALRDKASITQIFVEQLFTLGDPKRDPRGRIVSVAYYALVPEGRFVTATLRNPGSAVGRIEVPWSGEAGGAVHVCDENGKQLKLAFDHTRIIGIAVQRIRGKLNYAPIGFELLPDHFTLFSLQRIHEAVLGRKLNKDSFRRKMLASGLIKDTKQRQVGTAFRPPSLYRFKKLEK